MISVRWPSSARQAPTLIVVVVLPTPPFWLATAMIRGSGRPAGAGGWPGTGSSIVGAGDGDGVDGVGRGRRRGRRHGSTAAGSSNGRSAGAGAASSGKLIEVGSFVGRRRTERGPPRQPGAAGGHGSSTAMFHVEHPSSRRSIVPRGTSRPRRLAPIGPRTSAGSTWNMAATEDGDPGGRRPIRTTPERRQQRRSGQRPARASAAR